MDMDADKKEGGEDFDLPQQSFFLHDKNINKINDPKYSSNFLSNFYQKKSFFLK